MNAQSVEPRGLNEATSFSGRRQSHMNGAVAENLYRRENSSSQRVIRELQSDKSEALFGVKTRQLEIPENRSRRDDDTSKARADEAKATVGAPSTYDDTEPSESDSDKGKALAKKIRREERRLKREKEKKKKSKHKHHRKSSEKKVGIP